MKRRAIAALLTAAMSVLFSPDVMTAARKQLP